MNLMFGKLEGGIIRIEDRDRPEMKSLVAEVHGHSMEDEISKRPNAMAKLFAAAPGLRASLQAVVDQAEAQFKAGDRYATFSKVQIAQFKEDLKKAL